MSNNKGSEELPDVRQVANGIRDAYTLTEAEGILDWFIQAHSQRLVKEAVATAENDLDVYWNKKLERDLKEADTKARIAEAKLRLHNAERLAERARKWQLTEVGRRDMILGECLMPAQDRLAQLTKAQDKDING